MPKVSVIMGVYNCKDFSLLDKSVDSILDQSLRDIEFLICDDGSTNGTLEHLKEIEKKDNRIRVLSYTHNKGLAHALNTCLSEASGEYIARQDDDDISHPERLKKQNAFLDKYKEFAIVGTTADIYDDSGVWGEYRVPERPGKEDFLWNSPFMHPTIMARRNAYDVVKGYRIAKETRRCEDYDLFMRMYTLGIKGYNIQEKLYKYRIVNNCKTKHRPMKYRIDEAIVRFKGYKNLGLYPQGIIYVLKPIIIGLIPATLFNKIKKEMY